MLHHVEIYVSDLERSMEFWVPFMERLGCGPDRWSGGVNFFPEGEGAYLSFLEAPERYRGDGYHRQRVGLNHLAFRGRSREQVDAIRDWVREAGYALLYEDRYPYATAPGYYALFCEDPDRIKVEVVAPDEG